MSLAGALSVVAALRVPTLDPNGRIPGAQLGSGTPSESNFLRGDGSWQPAGGEAGPHAIDGASHTASGLTGGHVLRATGADTFAFGAIQDADLPAGLARDSEVAAAISAHEGLADPHAGYQKESEKAAANGYASLGADGLVPSAQLPVSGGSDPWTKVVLGADHTTSATANGPVAGLAFTPAAGKRYLVEVYLLLRTATATVGPRPGFVFPSGLADGGAWMQAPNSVTAYAMRSWGPATAGNAASTGIPLTTQSYLGFGGAYIITGASPSGSFGVTLASETAGTVVTIRAGSVLMYREI